MSLVGYVNGTTYSSCVGCNLAVKSLIKCNCFVLYLNHPSTLRSAEPHKGLCERASMATWSPQAEYVHVLFKETSNVAQTKSAPLCQRKYRHPLWKTWSPLTVDGYNAPSSVHIFVNIWSLLAFCLRGETNQAFIFLLKTEIVSWHEGECCTWVCFLFNEVLFLANAQLKIMGIWLWFGNGCYVARLVWLLSQLSLSL